MKEVGYTLLSAGDMSQATLNSNAQDLSFYWVFSVQAVFTGAPVGSISLSASNDNITFTTIAGTTTAISAASNIMWNVENAGYKYVRVEYVKTSGTGALTCKYFGKGA